MTFQHIKSQASEPTTETTAPEVYENGRQHLTDELLKLDALIYLRILNFPSCPLIIEEIHPTLSIPPNERQVFVP